VQLDDLEGTWEEVGSDAALVRQIRAGDVIAAPMLVSLYGDLLLGLVHAETPRASAAECEQLLGLALVSGVNSFGGFDPGHDTVLSWLADRVRCHSRDWIRADRTSNHARDGLDPQPSSTEASRTRAELAAIFAVLDSQDRVILALRCWNGLGYSTVADHLGIKEASARQQFKRALARFRDAVESQERALPSRAGRSAPGCSSSTDLALKGAIAVFGRELVDESTNQRIDALLRYDHPISPDARRRLIALTREALRSHSIHNGSPESPT
jgi:RNA polymerase sigma factor (sigma-70 family)